MLDPARQDSRAREELRPPEKSTDDPMLAHDATLPQGRKIEENAAD
jgi:hypothetical protein